MGISFDSIERNKAFAEKQKFDFPLLCDTEKKVGLAYGACDDLSARAPRRMSFLIDENGKIARVWPKVNPQSHPEAALAEI